jgi:Rrf2 family protein
VLGIKRETDYAVRTVLHLASLGGKTQVQVRDIADQRLLPLSFVRRIVARLSAAGILATICGMGGGIALARPAAQISLLDVVHAMEGKIALNQCLEPQHSCPLADHCPAQNVWAETTAILEAHLASVRFDSLAAGTPQHTDAHRKLVAAPGGGKAPKK